MIVISLIICDLTTNTNNNEYTLDSSKLTSIIFISILIHLIFVFASEFQFENYYHNVARGYKIHLI